MGTTSGTVLSVSGGTASSSLAPFAVTVSNINDAPQSNINGVNGLVMLENEERSMALAATDIDAGDSFVFSVLSNTLGSATVLDGNLVYTAILPGTEQLAITVTDGSGEIDSLDFPVSVRDPAASLPLDISYCRAAHGVFMAIYELCKLGCMKSH